MRLPSLTPKASTSTPQPRSPRLSQRCWGLHGELSLPSATGRGGLSSHLNNLTCLVRAWGEHCEVLQETQEPRWSMRSVNKPRAAPGPPLSALAPHHHLSLGKSNILHSFGQDVIQYQVSWWYGNYRFAWGFGAGRFGMELPCKQFSSTTTWNLLDGSFSCWGVKAFSKGAANEDVRLRCFEFTKYTRFPNYYWWNVEVWKSS